MTTTGPETAAAEQSARAVPGTRTDKGEPMTHTEQLIGVIEWPSDSGEPPMILVGYDTPAGLDRAFMQTLRHLKPGGEFEEFIKDFPIPAEDASDDEVLAWMVARHTDHISVCCSIYVADTARRGAADERRYGGRYLGLDPA
jgi:hypothetical protein